jgi:hypothetical protein
MTRGTAVWAAARVERKMNLRRSRLPDITLLRVRAASANTAVAEIIEGTRCPAAARLVGWKYWKLDERGNGILPALRGTSPLRASNGPDYGQLAVW